MRLIAVATAAGVPTVSLWTGTGGILGWRGAPRPGPEAILTAVEELLGEAGLNFADLDAVACGRGPGAFTGVRLGIALAQGLALGIGCPLVAVSELAALAWRAHRVHAWERVVACLDARQGEVYWATYECIGSEPHPLGAEALAAPREVVLPAGDGWALAGSGAELLEVDAEGRVDAGLEPDAGTIAELAAIGFGRGETLPPAGVEPAYLRNRVAEPKGGRS